MSAASSVIPLKGARGMIADHMVKSLSTAAQLTHHANADVRWVLALKQQFANAGHRVSVMDILHFAVLRALKAHPAANGHVQSREVHLFEPIHLSVAISLPGDVLVAPAVFDAGDMDVLALSVARRDLTERAKRNKISVKEMTGGTFTVSNLGLTRVEHFTPIINLPQICILGIGCTVDRPVRTDNGELAFHPFMALSLTFDHRALDGDPAGRFLTAVCEEIESVADSARVTPV